MPGNVSILQAALGLGITQGLAAGLFVGVAITAVVAWYNSRIHRRAD
jgi:hypothetical protein